MSGYTAFITYILTPASGESRGDYSQSIHCNYIKKITLNTSSPYIQEISLNFPSEGDFKFLSKGVHVDNPNGTGYTAHKIYALIQIVSNSEYETLEDVKSDSTAWRKFEITPQVSDYSTDSTYQLTPEALCSVVYKISLLDYEDTSIFVPYNLDYLNYPSISQPEELAFGDSTIFFGNVKTDIKADIYTTDISINLPLEEFNSSTNKTWDGVESTYISEIGIYDSNNNLVAIGKLNNPVAKDPSIARTIVFALDF